MKINYCQPLVADLNRVRELLKPSFYTGKLSNFGLLYEELVDRLTPLFSLTEDKKLVITSSGHTALMAAYSVLGTRVAAIPAYTFESTRAAADLQGIRVVPIDVDPQTGCISMDTLNNISPKVFDTLVVVCALSTIPDLQGIQTWCKAHNKKLIIDGAATFGTKGIYNFGDAFCLSFHATKTFSVGEAGAIIVNNEYCSGIKEYINFGFDDQKNVVRTGINAKVSEYTCAVALSLLDQISEEFSARANNLTIYKSILNEKIPRSEVVDTIYQALPVFLESKEKADNVRTTLINEGVQNLQYYRPLVSLPVSTDLYSRNISVPIHSGVKEEDIHSICSIILGE